jgi:hypothetical protein
VIAQPARRGLRAATRAGHVWPTSETTSDR